MINRSVVENRIQQKLQQHGPDARQSILDLLERGKVMRDYIVPEKELNYASDGNAVLMAFSDIESGKGVSVSMHANAIEQIGARNKIPPSYIKMLYSGKPWQKHLCATILDKHAANPPDGKGGNVLIRSVAGEARAVLSDKYRPLNMAPMFASFANDAAKYGAMLWNGICGDLKSYLEVVVPTVHEINTPRNGTVFMAFGMRLSSSDFGTGSVEVRMFNVQGVCANGMCTESLMREIHLGKRMDASSFAFSRRTYELDTQTVCSAIKDITAEILSDSGIKKAVNRIMESSEQEIPDMAKAIKALPAVGLTKEESEEVQRFLMLSSPDDGVQGELTKWKMQQAITAAARTAAPVRMREMQEIAGNLNL